MVIAVGDTLPDAKLARIGPEGPEFVDLSALTSGRKVVIFAVIGAFTSTCSNDHLPSFLRNKDQIMARGVDEIVCVTVNDPFVVQAWGEATGAAAAGLTVLSDPAGAFTTAIGMEFSAPAVGFVGRSKRYAMLVDDGRVAELLTDEDTRIFEKSSGEALLAAL